MSRRTAAGLSAILAASAVSVLAGQTAHADLKSPNDLQRGYVWYDADPVLTAEHGISNVIYLNNCKPNGCTVSPGGESAQNNRSSIPDHTSTVQPFQYSDQVWDQVVQCVKETYADFDVEIVTERPTTGDYHMAIVAGRPQDVQQPSGVGGVSPYTCGYIPNATSYSFANIYGGSVDDICWTVAQETAHSWGLDHKFDNRDPMTYLSSGPSRKKFIDESGACGTFSAQSCACGGNSMNSYREILATFGSRTPTPPKIMITSPLNGQAVQPGFPVHADITDDVRVASAALYIDNMEITSTSQMPFAFNAPDDLGPGTHFLEVRATDSQGAESTQMITFIIGDPCDGASDCPDASQTCVQGRCVAGESVDGGLGTECTNATDCVSGICAQSSNGGSYCVEMCSLSNDGCPSGFGCVGFGADNDDGGVCWPGAGDDGGCSAAGGSHGSGSGVPVGLPIGLAIAFAAVVGGRRRRR